VVAAAGKSAEMIGDGRKQRTNSRDDIVAIVVR
jgi:hypothetical protein